MRTLFNWLLRGLAAATVLGLGALALGWYLSSHSLPDYDATWRLPGVEGEIEIVRDNYAVPHIFAGSDRDVLFGLGFAHAQDRLWQMTMTRRLAQGRLSELFGQETFEVDHLMRALDLYGVAQRTAARQSEEVGAQLQAYADGVNAWLELVQDEALGRGAPEYFLFAPVIAPWTPADSVAMAKVLALRLTDKASVETLRARLSLTLDDPARLADILPVPPNAVMALPEYAGTLGVAGRDFAALEAPLPAHPLSPLAPPGLAGASNAFAAAGSRAAAGGSLLAADPHLKLTAPSPLYLARLELQSGGVIGATLPGVPGVIIGRNPDLAWGVTASYLDDQDIYIERLAEDDPGSYVTPGGTQAFETRESVIAIANAAPRTVTLRATRHGPVIPGNHFGAASVTPEGHVATLAWTGLETDDRTIEALLGLMRADGIAPAREALELVHAPALSVTLADREGVAIQATGAAPRRGALHTSQGRIPAAGWVARNDWQGYFPADENPGADNPPGGIVISTNNRLTDAPFPRHWSHDWGDSHRILRGSQLLNDREFHTLDSFVEAQTDTVSPAARALLPLIARNLWFQGEPAAQDTIERDRQIALETLANWNGDMTQHSFEPLIYAAWTRELQRRLIVDDLGPLSQLLSRPDPLFLERVFRDVDGASAWCDIRPSTAVETCEDVARLSLDAAILELRERFGGRIDSWRWGAAHLATHRHEVLGRGNWLDWFVNIRQETPGGDTTLMRGLTAADDDAPFANIHGAVYRVVVDFSDPEASVHVLSTGQSGHPLSRHYDDQSLLWRRGEYLPMSLDPAVARGGAVGITRIQPQENDDAR
ncbi:penicillin acylase family protein [Halovulum dunhuangense]|uniref:Penicillin acylase family protein n=1 Tax=Halovulum dunhuangense TaxID=1505036 RepID=A0A849L300_9RHOB|nr:penicillin acylase family protein [Halovulum dunhuangense]